jgi:hypothetical protein
MAASAEPTVSGVSWLIGYLSDYRMTPGAVSASTGKNGHCVRVRPQIAAQDRSLSELEGIVEPMTKYQARETQNFTPARHPFIHSLVLGLVKS